MTTPVTQTTATTYYTVPQLRVQQNFTGFQSFFCVPLQLKDGKTDESVFENYEVQTDIYDSTGQPYWQKDEWGNMVYNFERAEIIDSNGDTTGLDVVSNVHKFRCDHFQMAPAEDYENGFRFEKGYLAKALSYFGEAYTGTDPLDDNNPVWLDEFAVMNSATALALSLLGVTLGLQAQIT